MLENMHHLAIGLPRWISWIIPIPFYLLEMLIGLIQAFLFALLTAVYMFQVVLKAWFPRTDAPAIPEGSAHEAGWMMTVPTAVLAAACLVMGLFPQWLLDVIGKAVGL